MLKVRAIDLHGLADCPRCQLPILGDERAQLVTGQDWWHVACLTAALRRYQFSSSTPPPQEHSPEVAG